MTRVLHVVGGLNRGGVETWMIQVLRRMKDTGIQIDFLVPEEGPFHYQAEAEALGSRIIVGKVQRFLPLYAVNLLLILRKHGPYQAIHSHIHYFSGVPLLVAAIAGVPVRVVQSHLDTRELDATAGLSRRLYTRTMKWLIWNFATVGTAVSRRAADALFPPDWREHRKWNVMLLGVDTAPFEIPVDGDSLRRALNIPAGVTVIGHVGRFEAQKNHTFLLRVAVEYLMRVPEAVILLVGEGPLRTQIEAAARGMGILEQIRFAGVRKDVPALMRGVMDVFILPSLFEGLPLVLLEAQMAGLPCLLSDSVAEETDVMPALMHRESLSSSAASWASRLHALTQMPAAASAPARLEIMSIERSIEGLMACYSGPYINA